MSLAAQLVLAILLVIGGFGGGVKYHAGLVAQRDLQAQQLREADAREQRKAGDRVSAQHAQKLASLNAQLGDARETLARLPGRACLPPDAVGVLNATGVLDRPAVAGEPAGAASAAAAGTGLRWSTDTDVAGYIAVCRTRYAEVADQLNKILDLEDRRHPPPDPASQ